MPLVEERELYLVGFGPTVAPHVAWQREEPWLRLTSTEIDALVSAHGAGSLWVRQIGTYDGSEPLLIATIS